MRKALFITIGLCLVALPAAAFHDGGVAHCNGCHTIHNSEDGGLVDPDSPNGNTSLLRDAEPSTVCIACHQWVDGTFPAFPNPAIPPQERGAGNFVFLIEDNLNDGHGGATNAIGGDAAGHNLVSQEFGLAADGTLTTSPGGGYPAGNMACTSCHDPHGSASFRFLYGIGEVPGGPSFTAAAPVAEGLHIRGPAVYEAADNHTAYHSGMSAWCGNCHGDFHANGTQLIHESGFAMGDISDDYNLYNGSSDLFGATPADSYIPEVAFEDASVTTTSTTGPSGTSQVSCISCHRAHATSAPDATRWDMNVTHLAADGAESGSFALNNPYDVFQRSLCNKCHVKDEFSAVVDGTP